MLVRADDGVVLHVASHGEGPDVVVLSGGPGCVHYLADESIAPSGFRCWFPDPRGVGRSGGGPHTMARAVADLEATRRAIGVEQWIVLGHSWGSDLAIRYALDHPDRICGVDASMSCQAVRGRFLVTAAAWEFMSRKTSLAMARLRQRLISREVLPSACRRAA